MTVPARETKTNSEMFPHIVVSGPASERDEKNAALALLLLRAGSSNSSRRTDTVTASTRPPKKSADREQKGLPLLRAGSSDPSRRSDAVTSSTRPPEKSAHRRVNPSEEPAQKELSKHRSDLGRLIAGTCIDLKLRVCNGFFQRQSLACSHNERLVASIEKADIRDNSVDAPAAKRNRTEDGCSTEKKLLLDLINDDYLLRVDEDRRILLETIRDLDVAMGELCKQYV